MDIPVPSQYERNIFQPPVFKGYVMSNFGGVTPKPVSDFEGTNPLQKTTIWGITSAQVTIICQDLSVVTKYCFLKPALVSYIWSTPAPSNSGK